MKFDKKRGFLLLELSIMIIVVTIFSCCVVQAYHYVLLYQRAAIEKLKALMYLSSYIQSEGKLKQSSPYTIRDRILYTTPKKRVAIIEYRLIKEKNKNNDQESYSFIGGKFL
jgi:Tfp pilus assembly protein PilE